MKTKRLLLTPWFIVGLSALLLNDFYLKSAFGNFFTGKLSDFAGLLVFPLFMAAVFPRLEKSAAFITGIGFMLWKLPQTTPLIDFVNAMTGLGLYRVVDYTDYVALAVLPFSHYLINRRSAERPVSRPFAGTVATYVLAGIAFFAFCATSMPYNLYEMPGGTVFIGKSYTIKLPKDSVIGIIRNMGYNCDSCGELTDPSWPYRKFASVGGRNYYRTNNLALSRGNGKNGANSGSDSVACVHYTLDSIKPDRTRLFVINIVLPREGNIQDWKKLRALHDFYKKSLKKGLIDEIKN